MEKAIICLNYDDVKNIDIQTEREKFENIAVDSLLKNSGWYIVPKYIEYRANTNWFEYCNIVEFFLKRKTVELQFVFWKKNSILTMDFSFKDKFSKYFNALRDSLKVFESFNID